MLNTILNFWILWLDVNTINQTWAIVYARVISGITCTLFLGLGVGIVVWGLVITLKAAMAIIPAMTDDIQQRFGRKRR